jgi:hypothetical protein
MIDVTQKLSFYKLHTYWYIYYVVPVYFLDSSCLTYLHYLNKLYLNTFKMETTKQIDNWGNYLANYTISLLEVKYFGFILSSST